MTRYAGFWIRALASIIDALLFELLAAPFILLAYGPGYYDPEAPSTFIEGPVDFVVSWIVPIVLTILFWRYKRATPGKMLLKLEVVDGDTGEALSWGQCVARYVGYILAALPCGIGLFMVAFDPQKRGLHDRLANTIVRHR